MNPKTFFYSEYELKGPVLRCRNPLKCPWKGQTIEPARDSNLGGVLMCTPVLRELKRRNPYCYIRFYTRFVDELRRQRYPVLTVDKRPQNKSGPTGGGGIPLEC